MMSSDHFRAWRKALGWKQKEAAERLGLKKRMIQYYEKGNRDGKDVRIPKTVRLACYALSNGVDDFDGTSPVMPGEIAADADAPAEAAPAGKAARKSKPKRQARARKPSDGSSPAGPAVPNGSSEPAASEAEDGSGVGTADPALNASTPPADGAEPDAPKPVT